MSDFAAGKIIRGVGGFYYVACADGQIYECRARGGFREAGIRLLVGDDVRIQRTFDSEKAYTGSVIELRPRRNALVRPCVANVDQAVILFAIVRPDPNYNLLDRFLIMMRQQEVPVLICFNKQDIAGETERAELAGAYERCGYEVLFVSVHEQTGIRELCDRLRGRTSVMAGPSGAGKSSLINLLHPSAGAETGELSRKLARGRNTTRHSELFRIDALSAPEEDGPQTYLCDTPGFTALEVRDVEYSELPQYYEEFTPYEPGCRFAGCSHIAEPDCGVKTAVEAGDIARIRYRNYVTIYQDLKNRRPVYGR